MTESASSPPPYSQPDQHASLTNPDLARHGSTAPREQTEDGADVRLENADAASDRLASGPANLLIEATGGN